MILKIKRKASDVVSPSRDAWEFTDCISDVSCEIPALGEKTTFIHYKRHGEYITQLITGEAYLLNDNGQTIERIM